MGKYDFKLDLDSKNSLSMILSYIEKNSRILEFGCANGRMTKYLKEKLACSVDIVEIDYEAGIEAAKYANRKCLGKIEGNIENYKWYDILREERYDYIIFADVLEHLYHPTRVLKKCVDLLKKEGKILTSIPNIAHNSIIIGLINNKFIYTNVGLLDNTHIRFFTEESFISMIKNIGLIVEAEEAVIAKVGEMEVPTNYSMIDKNLQKYLKNRNRGEVYQYVFVLRKRNENATCSVNIENNPPYKCECFIQGENDLCYDGIRSIKKEFFCKNGDIKRIEFNLERFSVIKNIRIDPLDTNCVIEINNIEIFKDNSIKQINNFYTNGIKDGSLYIFGDDPQILIDNINDKVKNIIIEYKILNYDYDDNELFLNYYHKNKELELENNIIKDKNKELEKIYTKMNKNFLTKIFYKLINKIYK